MNLEIDYTSYGFKLERTAKRMRQSLQKKFNSLQIDITVDQWVILDQLYLSSGMSQNELADGTFKDAPTVTRIIDLLCKKEWAQRHGDKSDRRKFKIILTEKGLNLVKELLPTVIEWRKQGRKNINEVDFDNLLRILDSIFANFDE